MNRQYKKYHIDFLEHLLKQNSKFKLNYLKK